MADDFFSPCCANAALKRIGLSRATRRAQIRRVRFFRRTVADFPRASVAVVGSPAAVAGRGRRRLASRRSRARPRAHASARANVRAPALRQRNVVRRVHILGFGAQTAAGAGTLAAARRGSYKAKQPTASRARCVRGQARRPPRRSPSTPRCGARRPPSRSRRGGSAQARGGAAALEGARRRRSPSTRGGAAVGAAAPPRAAERARRAAAARRLRGRAGANSRRAEGASRARRRRYAVARRARRRSPACSRATRSRLEGARQGVAAGGGTPTSSSSRHAAKFSADALPAVLHRVGLVAERVQLFWRLLAATHRWQRAGAGAGSRDAAE